MAQHYTIEDSIAKAYIQMIKESSSPKITVSSKDYSWGKMKHINAGADYSIPLHPEHWQKIEALNDQESHNFTDETQTQWNVVRDGDDLKFKDSRYGSMTPTVSLSALQSA